ncbi:MAG TPA: molybdenum cofactor biosynthesis protein MoaE [Chthoniobacteraceae bacterium]|nr:molybdenum cofactor biosynthesis protein MoaE [Chthoniobacteraceae bacterium]
MESNPRIEIVISDRPLAPSREAPEGCGALAVFSGIVRREEEGRAIRALEYQAYQPMAEREIERVAREILAEHSCVFVSVHHRVGLVPVGEAAVIVQAASRHRAAALAFVATFMDRLKQDVPIWKIKALPA